MSQLGHLQPTAGVVPMSALTLTADIGLRSTPPPDVAFFVAATSKPFHKDVLEYFYKGKFEEPLAVCRVGMGPAVTLAA